MGELPVILMEIEPASGSIMKTYIYGNSEVLAQHNGPHTAAKYFYLHDRLGSVRQIINTSGLVQKLRNMVSIPGCRYMGKLTLINLFAFLCLCGSSWGAHIIEAKTIRLGAVDIGHIASVELLIAENSNLAETVLRIRADEGSFLYTKGSWMDATGLLNVFEKDGQLYMASGSGKASGMYKIVIRKVGQNTNQIGTIDTKGSLVERSAPGSIVRVIPVPEIPDSYYVLASPYVSPADTGEALVNYLSGGHGIAYVKPFLVEVQDGHPGKSQKLRYGGKTDETYYIRQIVQTEDLVHFLGFRQQEERAWGRPKEQFTPVILHHAAYDMTKKKVTQSNPVYTATPRLEKDKGTRSDYSQISIDAFADNVFVVFLWKKTMIQTKPGDVKYVESNIFYWDCNQGKAGKVEKIADGFLPKVKVDSLGNAHLLYVNGRGNLVHRVKQKGIWQKEGVLVGRVDVVPYIDNIAVAFDKHDNLHVVYPLGGNLVYVKMKLDSTPDE